MCIYLVRPFEKEFEYVVNLWAVAQSLPDFNASYSREESNLRDAVYR